MSGCKKLVFYLGLTLVISFALAFSQAQIPKELAPSKETEKLTPFEKGCSVCHSLEKIRLEMEQMIKEMHQKAGVQLSDKTIKEIEETFTLKPVAEPHEALFQEKCANCHSLQKVVMAHQAKDELEVKKIIQKMADKEKSGISKEEIDKIHRSMTILNEIYEKDIEVKSE
jgi:cytochrome c2